MGVVFDPERVAQGNIPTFTDGQSQKDAAIILGASLAELAGEQPYKDPELLAYMLYGSSVWSWRHESNRRSDLDVLAVVESSPQTQKTRADLQARFQAVSVATNVDIGPVVYDRTDLEEPVKLNPFYSEHLCAVRGFITNPDFQYFARNRSWRAERGAWEKAVFGILPFVDAWPFAVKYLEARRANFQSQLEAEPDLPALKGPFELPRNLGRTVRDLFTKFEVEHLDNYDPDRDEIMITVPDAQPDWESLLTIAEATDTYGLIGDDVERLHELDTDYTGLLEAAVAGEVSIAGYKKWLKSVYQEAFERAFKVVDLAPALVRRTVEMAQIDPGYDQIKFRIEHDLMYPESEESQKEFQTMLNRAGQIAPVEYDIERLLFTIAPKYPNMARRYQEHEKKRRESRRISDELAMEMLEYDKKAKERLGL